jgi:hypothetical protein
MGPVVRQATAGTPGNLPKRHEKQAKYTVFSPLRRVVILLPGKIIVPPKRREWWSADSSFPLPERKELTPTYL